MGTAVNVEVEKVKDNLYVMKGGGGNSAVFIGTDGVTVVDTKNPGWGAPLHFCPRIWPTAWRDPTSVKQN